MGLSEMLGQGAGGTFTATEQALLPQGGQALGVLPHPFIAMLGCKLFKQKSCRRSQIARQKKVQGMFTGLKRSKEAVFHVVKEHRHLSQWKTNMIQAILVQSRVADALSIRIEYADQNQR
jgi:hypothetical protein